MIKRLSWTNPEGETDFHCWVVIDYLPSLYVFSLSVPHSCRPLQVLGKHKTSNKRIWRICKWTLHVPEKGDCVPSIKYINHQNQRSGRSHGAIQILTRPVRYCKSLNTFMTCLRESSNAASLSFSSQSSYRVMQRTFQKRFHLPQFPPVPLKSTSGFLIQQAVHHSDYRCIRITALHNNSYQRRNTKKRNPV